MPSEASLANRRYYEWVAAQVAIEQPPQEATAQNDAQWTMLTAEPGGVNYTEIDASGTRALRLLPHDGNAERVILCVHGGGFVGGSIYTHRKMYAHLAKAAGVRGLCVDYDLIYESPWPRQLDQVTNAFLWLLGTGIRAEHIVLAGDSAGATLVFSLLQRIKAEGLPMPAGAVSISGWLDMTASGASYDSNAAKDPFFNRDIVGMLADLVLGGRDRTDPQISAVHGDLRELPPLYLQVGADEALLDDSRILAARAVEAGVDARVSIFPDMLHSFQMMCGRAPEADEAIAMLAKWVRLRLGLGA